MLYHWLHNEGKDKVILFFGGWGTDMNPFEHLKSDHYDVVMFYDYRSLELLLDLNAIVNGKKEVVVVGWSLGVWLGHYTCQQIKTLISKAIAINGTLDPISDKQGIPVDVFSGTLKNLSEENLDRFNRRMMGEKDDWTRYKRNQPFRNWMELMEELAHLKYRIKPQTNSIYTEAVITNNDMIFTARNQENFWRDKVSIQKVDGAHFPFFKYQSWDEIISN